MTKIDFDEPSTGSVSSDEVKALTINASGRRSVCISCESTDGVTIIAKSNLTGVHGSGSVGVFGASAADDGRGVKAVCTTPGLSVGVEARIKGMVGYAVLGTSQNSNPDSIGHGVGGFSSGGRGTGVVGVCERGTGVLGRGKNAGRFEGDVEVTGDIKLLNPMNADCAEDFDIFDSETNRVEPGTVMVLTENGYLESCNKEYDKKVAGIVSGAGGYKPALVLNRYSQSQNANQNKKNKIKNKHRLPIALMGKVYCKVDARNSPIEIGDLLTTSTKKGYAMKADDHAKAFGAVIGKALNSIKGVGMIPVLVTLQ
jgi:hypothetical protein